MLARVGLAAVFLSTPESVPDMRMYSSMFALYSPYVRSMHATEQCAAF